MGRRIRRIGLLDEARKLVHKSCVQLGSSKVEPQLLSHVKWIIEENWGTPAKCPIHKNKLGGVHGGVLVEEAAVVPTLWRADRQVGWFAHGISIGQPAMVRTGPIYRLGGGALHRQDVAAV
jgi:hypothetical protein